MSNNVSAIGGLRPYDLRWAEIFRSTLTPELHLIQPLADFLDRATRSDHFVGVIGCLVITATVGAIVRAGLATLDPIDDGLHTIREALDFTSIVSNRRHIVSSEVD